MADNLNKVEALEKDLASDSAKFKESSEILNDLAKIQHNFEDLAQKYQGLKDEHQKLAENLKESRQIVAALQIESESAVEQVIQTNETVQQDFTNLQQEIIENFTQFQKALQDESRQISGKLQAESKESIEDILKNHKALKQSFSNMEQDILDNFAQSQEDLNQRFLLSEKGAEAKWQEFTKKVAQKLSGVDNQIKNFQGELESKILERLNNLGSSQQAIQQQFRSFELELKNTKILIEEVRKNNQHQLEQVQNRIQKAEEQFAQSNQSFSQTRGLIYIIAAGSIFALILAVASFLIPSRGNTSRQAQISQLLNPNHVIKH
ncbi:MAG: hypothetical protein IGS39_23085 [Calothrix sp. C42_A2020_038]|nr:hypothetical protein [Calothrix sp. C42_A2020_038]